MSFLITCLGRVGIAKCHERPSFGLNYAIHAHSDFECFDCYSLSPIVSRPSLSSPGENAVRDEEEEDGGGGG